MENRLPDKQLELMEAIIEKFPDFTFKPEALRQVIVDARYYRKQFFDTETKLHSLTTTLERISGELFDWMNTFCDHESVEKSWVEETEELLETTSNLIHKIRGTKPEWK